MITSETKPSSVKVPQHCASTVPERMSLYFTPDSYDSNSLYWGFYHWYCKINHRDDISTRLLSCCTSLPLRGLRGFSIFAQGHRRQIECCFPEALSQNDKMPIHTLEWPFPEIFPPCDPYLSSSLQDLIDAVVTAAKASADNLIRREGRGIQLEESLDLHLPFLLPEGGYSCDTVRGIPPGFREFLEPICGKGSGFWIVCLFCKM